MSLLILSWARRLLLQFPVAARRTQLLANHRYGESILGTDEM